MTLIAWLILIVAIAIALLVVWAYSGDEEVVDEPQRLDVQNHRGD